MNHCFTIAYSFRHNSCVTLVMSTINAMKNEGYALGGLNSVTMSH